MDTDNVDPVPNVAPNDTSRQAFEAARGTWRLIARYKPCGSQMTLEWMAGATSTEVQDTLRFYKACSWNRSTKYHAVRVV